MNKDKLNKIHIVGIYGSGKSTLAKKISKILGIKTYDLDEIKYKRKYDRTRSVPERKRIIRGISLKKKWITEGAWLDYAKELYQRADLVIFLEIPKRKLYYRILKRHFERKFSKDRIEKHNLKTTFNILKKVKQYFNDPTHFMTLKSHKEYIKRHSRNSITFRNNKEINKFLETIK